MAAEPSRSTRRPGHSPVTRGRQHRGPARPSVRLPTGGGLLAGAPAASRYGPASGRCRTAGWPGPPGPGGRAAVRAEACRGAAGTLPGPGLAQAAVPQHCPPRGRQYRGPRPSVRLPRGWQCCWPAPRQPAGTARPPAGAVLLASRGRLAAPSRAGAYRLPAWPSAPGAAGPGGWPVPAAGPRQPAGRPGLRPVPYPLAAEAAGTVAASPTAATGTAARAWPAAAGAVAAVGCCG